MIEGTGKKLFSAELQRMKAKNAALPPADRDLGSVLGAIAALSQDVQALDRLLRQTVTDGRTAPQEAPPPPVEMKAVEVDQLKAEIRSMSDCIQQTKIEIAALRPPHTPSDRLATVTDELDAIVSATEIATEGILESAEVIDGLAHQLQTHQGDAFISQIADDIREAVVRLFEECNFQDITGQRINKVVTTLQYVEERVNRMIDIWGKDSFTDLPLPEEVEGDEDRKLLNGPALANQGISQEDIDKLFG